MSDNDCAFCQQDGCLVTHVVSVPADLWCTVDPEVAVGADCVADAVRYLEAQPFAVGAAQVDRLTYEVAS